MLMAGFFADVTFFMSLMSLMSFDSGWTDRNVDCCIKTINEKITRLKFW